MTDTDQRHVLGVLADAIDAGESVVLATVVATKRSVPRRAGTKMLVFGDGRLVGTVGGGAMESRVIEAARNALTDGKTRLVDYDLVDPSRGDPGVCGGTVQIYLEPYMPPPTLFIVGAGHVGRTVTQLAHWLGYRTVVTDDRADRLEPEEFPDADERIAGPIADAISAHPITEDTMVIVVSRDVEIDVAALPVLLETPARYVGVMGSARRWDTTRQRLVDGGVDARMLDRVHAPIGVEIGAETLEEIAVSILAELIAFRRMGEA